MTIHEIIKNELLIHVKDLITADYQDEFLIKVIEDYIYGIDWNNKYLAHKGLRTMAFWIIKKHKLN